MDHIQLSDKLGSATKPSRRKFLKTSTAAGTVGRPAGGVPESTALLTTSYRSCFETNSNYDQELIEKVPRRQ